MSGDAPRPGVATRLALLLGGLATLSTGFALVLQDRALDQDLREAARERLQRSARATDRLVEDHLLDMAGRYAAISRAPEFRANLATGHEPTLRYYAAQLLDGQGAAMVAFLDREGALLAPAGDPRLVEGVLARVLAAPPDGPPACVAATEAATADARTEPGFTSGPGPVRGPGFASCRYPAGPAEATLFRPPGDELYALVAVPLRTDGRLVGGLVAVEPVDAALLGSWSELSGATVHAHEPPRAFDLVTTVRRLPGLDLRVSTTYEAERRAIARARRNLVVSGVGVLLLALVASYLIANGFARPIVELREATERLSEGRLDQRIDLRRDDELGALGRAFNDLASRLQESQEALRRAQRLARFGSWQLDLDERSVGGTPEFQRLFDLGEEGSPVRWGRLLARVHPDDRAALERAVDRCREVGGAFRIDVRVGAAGGRERILHLRGQAREPGARRIECSAQDVTERRTAEEQIRYLSMHDPLTGLGNREYLNERLVLRLRGGRRRPLALLLVGLDDFQGINDTFGPAVGDEILTETAARLQDFVGQLPHAEAGDPQRSDVVVRLGGDRFGIVLDGTGDERACARIATELIAHLERPQRIEGEEIAVSATIGIAVWPTDGEDAETLLRNGDTALHRAKRDGRGRYGFFHEWMQQDASRRLRVANLLRRAVERGGLELHYQPRVEPESGELVGFEALVRWTDPELGRVSPDEFIPVAEATGTIGALGDWCLETAARRLREWHEAGREALRLSINLSRYQLGPGLLERLLALTDGLDPSRFELEVTESALIEEGDEAIEVLRRLRDHGFRISLDDFGSGYSSLSYLKGLPIDTVKVDRGFIREIVDDEDAAALTGSVLDMCRALRLHTVVEGVETEAQKRVLLELGCREAQGFLFGRPMPASRATELVLGTASPGAGAADRAPRVGSLPI